MAKLRYVFLFVILLTLNGCFSVWKDYEEPRYEVLQRFDKNVEVRRYQPMIVAEVTVSGARGNSSSKGFRILADYIFGNNTVQNNIAMTAPVTQEPISTSIDMTTPVTQTAGENGQWIIRFVMPREYTLETLPKPNNDTIRIYETKPYDAVAIRFSGTWRDANFIKHNGKLKSITDNHTIFLSTPAIYAYYNDPFTPWFLRRNEIIYNLDRPYQP